MAKTLLDSDASDNEGSNTSIDVESDFKVNEDFAKRFTHNKKREELRRCECYDKDFARIIL
jgi:protein KRI1